MLDPLVSTAVGVATNVAKRAFGALTGREKSLLDFTRVGQVTPMVIVDSDIRFNPLTKDILHCLSTMFTGYYMQALAYEDLIDDVKITDRLDKFNPSASKPFFKSFSFESNGGFGLPATTVASMEAYDKGTPGRSEVVSKDNINEMFEDRSLAVGKMITVKLHDRAGQQRPVPVTIRLIPMIMDTQPLLTAYSIGSRWNTQTERKFRMETGELSKVADYLFKADMIEEHRQALLKDKSGVYGALAQRRTDKLLGQIADGKESMAAAAAMTIISAKTAKELERRLGGKLSNYKVRERLFDEHAMMILVVYDPGYDQAVFYFRGSPDASELSANEIKVSSKKQDVNMMELINTFMNKGAPSF